MCEHISLSGEDTGVFVSVDPRTNSAFLLEVMRLRQGPRLRGEGPRFIGGGPMLTEKGTQIYRKETEICRRRTRFMGEGIQICTRGDPGARKRGEGTQIHT